MVTKNIGDFNSTKMGMEGQIYLPILAGLLGHGNAILSLFHVGSLDKHGSFEHRHQLETIHRPDTSGLHLGLNQVVSCSTSAFLFLNHGRSDDPRRIPYVRTGSTSLWQSDSAFFLWLR